MSAAVTETGDLDNYTITARKSILDDMRPKVVAMATEQRWTPELCMLVIDYVESLTMLSDEPERPVVLKNTFVRDQVNRLFKATCFGLKIKHDTFAGQRASWYVRKRPRHQRQR